MIFTSVEIQNFLRFKEATVPLKDQGLVLVNGVNHDSTAADSNGAGKSSVFEAIVWCLWGKTVRGYSGDKVINRTVKKDCWVRLKIEHNGETYSVERYRKHHQYKNELHFMHYAESGPVDMSAGTPTMTQQVLDDWLGIDFATYTRGPMVGQGHFKRFSQMTDAEQKGVLETALQVGVLSAAKDIVKSRTAALDLKVYQSESDLKSLNEKHDYLLSKLSSCADEYKDEWRKYQGTMKGMYTYVVGAVLQAEQAERELAELPEADLEGAKAVLGRLDGLREQQEASQNEVIDRLLQAKNNRAGELQAAKSLLNAAERELKRFRSSVVVGQACPTCLQPATKEHRESCMQELVGKISEHGAAVVLAEQELATVQRAIEETQEANRASRESTTRILDTARERLREAERIVSMHEYWQTSIDEAEIVRQKELERFRLWAAKSVPKDRAHELNDELEEAILQRQAAEDQLTQLQDQLSYLQFWTQGFGNSGLKSLIFDSIVPFLNDRAKLYSRDLTDGEVVIEFSTKTTLKSGETREKFQVLTSNVNGADDYEGGSGGEKARVDLAINFALSDLMGARAKKAFPQRFFDEPFEGLDEAGLEAVMDLLAQMTQQCGTIFVVTHKPALASLFNKVVTVHKRGGVSVLEA